mgnify:FL=1
MRESMRVLLLVLAISWSACVAGQDGVVKINGYLIDEQNGNRLSDILVVNETSGAFVYGDQEGNYTIEAKKKDRLVFSALGYSSVNFSLRDSIDKLVYLVIPRLNKYTVLIKEVSVEAKREITAITVELSNLTRGYYHYQQYDASQSTHIASPITSIYNKRSRREESKRKVEHLKYLARKKILLLELIRRSKLSQTELLSEEEQCAFIDELLKYDFRLVFSNEYELLAYINNECKKWMGEGDEFNVRSRSK